MSDASLPPAIRVLHPPLPGPAYDRVVLAYDARLLRRKRLTTMRDKGFLVDLPQTISLVQGDAFELADGRLIEVIAAAEALMEVRGPALHRLAWHIGNRHAPCQIEPDRLVIKADRVLRQMLLGLGAVVNDVSEPFAPEGGAYGHGRTLGHSHGTEATALQAHDDAVLPPHLHDHEHEH